MTPGRLNDVARQRIQAMTATTDGFRLAVRTVELPEGGPELQMIVPAKTVSVLQRILPNVEGSVGIRFSENQIIVACGNYVLSSALVEGHFPNYQEVIPKDNDKSAVALVRENEYPALASEDRELKILAAGETYGHGGITLKMLLHPLRERLLVVGH